MILLKGSSVQPCGDAATAARAVARRRGRVAPQDAVGAGLEASHIAGDELRSDRHRPVVDLSCTPLAKPKYTRKGAMPAIVLTLLARPFPANTRLPAKS